MHPGDKSLSKAPSATGRPQAEAFLVAVFILFTTSSFFLIQYDRMRNQGPSIAAWIHEKFSGTLSEGDQYRIGVPYLAYFLDTRAHLRPNQSVPLIESITYALALVLLYLQLRSSPRLRSGNPYYRFVALGFFFAAVQFPSIWVFPWERPETLPSACFLAAIILLVISPSRMPFALTCMIAILLTAAQALTRSDATVAVGLAILIAAAAGLRFPRSRSSVVIIGLLCCAVGGITQLYLQRVAFPRIASSQTSWTFQLFHNMDLKDAPFHTPIFLTAVLPLMVSIYLLHRFRLDLDTSDKLVLLTCLIYLVAWVTMGLVSEVRIFVPYLFLAAPTIAKLWAAFLFNEERTAFRLGRVG